ncbi:Uncharacterised protein [uncultured archaeon]|nr:Uncharacterised protein [uncultured archaeon]
MPENNLTIVPTCYNTSEWMAVCSAFDDLLVESKITGNSEIELFESKYNCEVHPNNGMLWGSVKFKDKESLMAFLLEFA